MSNELYGAQGGSRLAEQDIQGQEMNALAMMHTMGQIAQQPADLRLKTAQAASAETALLQQQKMQAALAGMANRPPTPMAPGETQATRMSGQLYEVADMMMKLGAPTEAGKYSAEAAKLAQTELTGIAAKAKAAKDNLTSQHQKLQFFEGITRGVEDQAGWDAANRLYEQQYKQPSPFSGTPYSPQLLDSVRESMLTQKDALAMEQRQAEQEDKKEYREQSLDVRRQRAGYEAQRTALAERREARLAKAGGKVVGAATKQEEAAAVALVRSDLFAGLAADDFSQAEKDTIKLGALDMVGRAKAKTQANKGLDFQTALNQVYQESKAAGEWEDAKESTHLGLTDRKSKKFVGARGNSADAPIAAPADKSALVAGKYYRSPNGAVARWDGSKFVMGGAKAPARAAASSTPASPDDEEEEEEE